VSSLSTLLALVLDIYVFKQAIRLGKYQTMKDADMKQADAAFQDSDHEMSGFNGAQEMSANEHKAGGYSVPQQQFGYDTSYGASRTGFRD
jgi:hypothetical protein